MAVGGAVNAARSQAPAASDIGRIFTTSIANGMVSQIAAVHEAARQVVQAAENAAMAEAEIASPSRVWRDMGLALTQGLELGIRSGTPDVVAQVGSLFRDVSQASAREIGLHVVSPAGPPTGGAAGRSGPTIVHQYFERLEFPNVQDGHSRRATGSTARRCGAPSSASEPVKPMC